MTRLNGRRHAEIYERPIMVYLSCCREKVPEKEVGFINIYEDIEGRDWLVFRCPVCRKKHESLRFG